MQEVPGTVTPAEAGVQYCLICLDSGFCRNDEKGRFLTFYETVKTGWESNCSVDRPYAAHGLLEMNGTVDLRLLHEMGRLSFLDIHFASFMETLNRGVGPGIALAAALVSSITREGHICLDLSRIAGKEVEGALESEGTLVYPGLEEWCEGLAKSKVVGRPGEYRPLILDEKGRLYLYRYWDYEARLADLLKARISMEAADWDRAILGQGLSRLFPHGDREEVDWQKVAAYVAATRRFCVISGGPGTGKTTTVARILALLIELSQGRRPRIGLVSPTGKGAMRLQDAIRQAKGELPCDPAVRDSVPEEASTIHRLLGAVPGSPYFRHDRENRLPVDVLLVDEASMVDLALMSKLVQALSEGSRLILLGDKDQLASVEAGAVLGDLCGREGHSYSRGFLKGLQETTGYSVRAGEKGPAIRDCVIHLQKNFRFGRESGIGELSRAVNEGDGERAMDLLKGGGYPDIEWHALPPAQALALYLRDKVMEEFMEIRDAGDAVEGLRVFERFRIMCALREGPWGVKAINRIVEGLLRGRPERGQGDPWYRGRPILINANDYGLRLFNGDVGVVLPDPDAGGDLRVFFPAPEGGVRRFHPVRLPEHETCYAMTVHKAQGSEFEEALLLLPDRDSPVLTRELIYTAITRARRRVAIWGAEGVFRQAVTRRLERASGLRDALWG